MIYWGCGEKLREPIGEGFELLNIKNIGPGGSEIKIYEIDILYTGDKQPESLVSTVKYIHNQYSELKMKVWLSKDSYKNKINGNNDSSIDVNLVIESQKSYSKSIDRLRWIQIYGDYKKLYNKSIVFNKEDSPTPIKKTKVSKEPKKVQKTVTTNYDCRLLPNPNSNVELTRIPKNTELVVLESKDVQQGRMLNTWYKVEYNNKTGWTSSFNMKSKPKVRILSVEESKKNYEKQIGSKPYQNPLTGTISIVDKWLKKNKNNYETIKYRQWYEPYVINNQWVCRVEYDETIGGLTITSDMMFFIENNEVVSFSEK